MLPNTACPPDQMTYRIGDKFCDKIIPIMKSGEMAGIQWFQIIKDGKIIAEIKESICNIYGEDDYQESTIPF